MEPEERGECIKYLTHTYTLDESGIGTLLSSITLQLQAMFPDIELSKTLVNETIQKAFLHLCKFDKKTGRVNLKMKRLEDKCYEFIAIKDKHRLLATLRECLDPFRVPEEIKEKIIWKGLRSNLIDEDDLRDLGFYVIIAPLKRYIEDHSVSTTTTPEPLESSSTAAPKRKKAKPPTNNEDLPENSGRCLELLSALRKLCPKNAQMRKLPRHCSKKGVESESGGGLYFTAQKLLFLLKEIYGSYDYFFECLFSTQIGKSYLSCLLQRHIDCERAKAEVKLEKAKQLGQLETLQELSSRALLVFAHVQKGLGNSDSTFTEQRHLLERELPSEAMQRALAKLSYTRRTPPAVVLNAKNEILPTLNSLILHFLESNIRFKFKQIGEELLKSELKQRSETQPNLKKLFDWMEANPNDYGSFLKTIYFSQVEWNPAWTQIVQTKTKEQMHPTDWKNLAPHLGEHAALIIPNLYNYELNLNPIVRRKPFRLFGRLAYHILPKSKEVTAAIKTKLIEDPRKAAVSESMDISINTPIIIDHNPDTTFVEQINKGGIYIGGEGIYKSTQNPRLEAPYRILEIRKVVIQRIVAAANYGWLNLNSQNINVYLKSWTDGTTSLGDSFMDAAVGIVYDRGLFSERAPFARATQIKPWFIGFLPEDIEAVTFIRNLLGEQLKNLHPFRLDISGTTFTFKFTLTLDCFDHSEARKAVGSNAGGHYRCEECAANFDVKSNTIHLLFSYKHQNEEVFQRNLHSIVEIAKTWHTNPKDLKKAFDSIGQRAFPPIHTGNLNQSLEELGLHRLISAPDNLHNISGAIAYCLRFEKDCPKREKRGWDNDEFERNLSSELHRTSTTGMNGAQWRFLCANYKTVILPSITHKDKAKVESLWETLAEIMWIAYGEPWIRSAKEIRLRLHVNCFLFGILLQELYGNKIYQKGVLYAHTIHSHFPRFYEKSDFRNGSCESGEQQLCTIKGIQKYCTNRHQPEALKETLVRLHYRDEVKPVKASPDESKISEAFAKTKVWKELCIPSQIVNRWADDVLSLLLVLQELGYTNGTFYTMSTETGAIMFNTVQRAKEIHDTQRKSS